MADYYTQCSFVVPCTQGEAFGLQMAIDNPEGLPAEMFDDPDYRDFGVSTDASEGGIWIWGDSDAQPYQLGSLIQALAPSVLPFGFVFASSCSKARLDSYGGGYVLVTADSIEIKTIDQVLAEALGDAKL